MRSLDDREPTINTRSTQRSTKKQVRANHATIITRKKKRRCREGDEATQAKREEKTFGGHERKEISRKDKRG